MKYLIIVCVSVLTLSCSKLPYTPLNETEFGGGAFILNEGKFLAGNGSLSFFSYDSSSMYNDLFLANNGRPLGDIPYSMLNYNGKLYIIVNNSGKIEIIDQYTCRSSATISGLVSPRKMAILDNNKAYVTSLYSDSLTIVDLSSNTISGYIDLKHSSESIVLYGNKAFVANWVGGNKVYVIDTFLNTVIDSITVGLEPESMAFDRYNRLWVLSNGGWRKTQKAEIDIINADYHHVEHTFFFASDEDSPTCLVTNGTGDIMYFLNKGVYSMDINTSLLPQAPFINETGQAFYKISVNPVNGDILVTDVIDYRQNGYLNIYQKDGQFLSKHRTGLIPGEICFRIDVN
jgi:YVTN family beta-propeller protein